MRFWATIAAIIMLDQFSKIRIMELLDPGDSIPLIHNLFSLTFVMNRGAAFGVLQGKSWLFLIMALLIICIMIYVHLAYELPVWVQYAMGFIVGGTMGNLIDRWSLGAVRDFFSIGWFPVFNVADMAIVTGGGLLILYLFLNEPDRKQIK
ncbi:MAG: signal peptidase II [Syntrophomonadaceae bacterium]